MGFTPSQTVAGSRGWSAALFRVVAGVLPRAAGSPRSYWPRVPREFSLKIDDDHDGALTQLAQREGISRTRLARRYIAEGVLMDVHPGIVFRDGPAGRRAALATGPDVWQIVEVAKVFAGQAPAAAVQRTAAWLSLPPALVQAAIAYYADRRPEIEALIARNAEALAEAGRERR